MSITKPVLIRCKLHRAGGSKIDVYGEHYHFKPADADKDNPEAPHVAAIPFEHARQIHRLLSIKEGYELADPDAEIPAKPKAPAGQTMAGEMVSGGSKPADAPVMIKSPEGDEINLSDMSAEDLRIFAKETFAIKVHHKWDDKTVIAKIIEATRASDE